MTWQRRIGVGLVVALMVFLALSGAPDKWAALATLTIILTILVFFR